MQNSECNRDTCEGCNIKCPLPHVKAVKPPLVLMPRQNWLRLRYLEILNALTRYEQEGFTPKIEWLVELVAIYDELEDINNGKSTY